MRTLGCDQKIVRMAGTLLVSHIAAIELPNNNWYELIDLIMNNIMIDDLNVKLSCIQTTG